MPPDLQNVNYLVPVIEVRTPLPPHPHTKNPGYAPERLVRAEDE